MASSVNTFRLSCFVVSTLVAMATAQGGDYLPPSKGYNYDKPSIPFPPNNNGNKQPGQVPSRPQRPQYIPPQQPTPPSHEHHNDHEHHDGGYPQHDGGHHQDGGHHHDGDHHHHHEPGMPFDFSYAVNGDGNDYSHNAISDGDVTTGEYRVALPDGRTQIVKYTADWKNGFNAEVTYEGEAQYPEPQGYGRGPASSGQEYAPASQGGGYQY